MLANAVLGHGLKVVTNAALTRAIGYFCRALSRWVITGLWTAISVAGPAYRVTIPCVCHGGLSPSENTGSARILEVTNDGRHLGILLDVTFEVPDWIKGGPDIRNIRFSAKAESSVRRDTGEIVTCFYASQAGFRKN